MASKKTLSLFGGPSRPWAIGDWTSSDDRVRGGKSISNFRVEGDYGCFFGNLDIKTLGGAGFASQRTTSSDLGFDLAAYDGLELEVVPRDRKEWTLILKDELLSPADNGRERATVSWEASFSMQPDVEDSCPLLIWIPWTDFKPTYRGKDLKDVEPLNTASIKRLSLMVRSFFGSQEGPFCLKVHKIRAYKGAAGQNAETAALYHDDPSRNPDDDGMVSEKAAWHPSMTKNRKARGCFCGFL